LKHCIERAPNKGWHACDEAWLALSPNNINNNICLRSLLKDNIILRLLLKNNIDDNFRV
jgi:hypothetical protein